ncbi:rab-GTPase-TBC domain-containing protein [Dipodascopsis uninucleata]
MEPPIIMPEISQLTPHQRFRQSKERQIRAAIADRDHKALEKLAKTKAGLLNDSLRKEAWPILLGCDTNLRFFHEEWQNLPPHNEEEQVRLDVDRSFIFYPIEQTETQLKNKRNDLYEIIIAVLRLHPNLSYFQGYHDICQVIYLVFGRSASVPVIEYLSLHRLRDFMMSTLQPALDQLHLIPVLLKNIDPSMSEHLKHTKPYYALSAILTMFCHDIQSYSDICLMFDFFFGCEDAAMPIYLYTTILLSRRDEILEVPSHESEILHAIASRMPQPLPISLSSAMAMSLSFHTQFPTSSLLPAWGDLSPYSFLKTWHFPEEVLLPTSPVFVSSRRRSHTRRRRKLRDQQKPEEYDYIEMNEVSEKRPFEDMETVLIHQIADTQSREAKEKARMEKARQARMRQAATKRLTETVANAVPRVRIPLINSVSATISNPEVTNTAENGLLIEDAKDPSSTSDKRAVERSITEKSQLFKSKLSMITSIFQQFPGHSPAIIACFLSMSLFIGIFGVWLSWISRSGASWSTLME